MKPNTWIACGALLAGLSVAAGAFGAHGLTTKLKRDTSFLPETAQRRLEIFDTAARYQMYHALAIALVGLVGLRSSSPCLSVAGWSFVVGIALFCGCLYVMALGGPQRLGAVVPFGGAAFITGWVCLAIAAWKSGQVWDQPGGP